MVSSINIYTASIVMNGKLVVAQILLQGFLTVLLGMIASVHGKKCFYDGALDQSIYYSKQFAEMASEYLNIIKADKDQIAKLEEEIKHLNEEMKERGL